MPDRPQAARCRRTGPGRGASRAGPGARAASHARARREDQQEHRGGQQPPPALHQHRLSLGFFTDKLLRQASPNTIAAYRDTCKLLLDFASRQARKQPCQLDIADLDAPLITAFLQHLETGRANTVTTRNARLAAIHSLFRYVALHTPEHAGQISRVLAIPPKRCDRAIVSFLTAEEIDALLAAPDRATWLGRRDHALLLIAVQTGLRVSELTGLTCSDVHLGPGTHV